MAERSPSTAPRGWRDAAASRPTRGGAPISRRAALVGLVLATLTGVGVVVWLVSAFGPAPGPRFVALWVADYRDPRFPTDPSSARTIKPWPG
jgi:hypothetical protein